MKFNILNKTCSICNWEQIIIDNKVVQEGRYNTAEAFINGLIFCGNEIDLKNKKYICEYCSRF